MPPINEPCLPIDALPSTSDRTLTALPHEQYFTSPLLPLSVSHCMEVRHTQSVRSHTQQPRTEGKPLYLDQKMLNFISTCRTYILSTSI
uniref:Uncharacterized protein n=1 Tax=Picea glauca TaxID=3330 RepID=A0A117NIE4_PICGL|nr:hypothetical protein ABT39_MTgene2972 [Picea glauca]